MRTARSELVGVAVELRARHRRRVDDDAWVWRRRRALSASTISSRSTVSRCDASSAEASAAREREQVVDEALQADGVVEHVALGRLPVGALGVGEVDLELGADAGERAAQLVAGVGDEPALALGGVLEPGEHRVHRAGEPADLVVGRGLGHPAVQVLGADRLDLARGSPRPGAARDP